MAGVAFAVEGDGVGFATESYAASALYTTLANLSGARWRIKAASSLTGWLRCGHSFPHALDFDRHALLILSVANAFQVVLQVKVILQKYFALIRAGIPLRVSRAALCRLSVARCKAHEDHENSHRGSPPHQLMIRNIFTLLTALETSPPIRLCLFSMRHRQARRPSFQTYHRISCRTKD
jgi:hypothetical protein